MGYAGTNIDFSIPV